MQKKSLQTILYSIVGVILVAIILVGFNVIISTVPQRIDLTKEKAYTLSKGTREILGRLDTPVKIRYYCSQSDSASSYSVLLKSYAKKVEDLLAEYKQAAHGKLIIEKYDPQPDSDAEDSARLDGIEEEPLPAGEKFYLGLAVSMVDSKQSIPFFSPERERQLEYDISRAISRAASPEKPVVGVMSSLQVFGTPSNPMMMQMGQRGQEAWALIGELRNDFTLKNVPMDTEKIDDEIKVLLVIHPKGISDKVQYAIDQFVMRGGKLIAFLDSQSLIDSQGQNPMMGGPPPGGSSLDKLLKAWGLQFDTSKVVADRTFKMVLGEEGDTSKERPAWLMLNSDGVNLNDVTTAELDNVWYFSGGAFTGTPVPGLTETVLLKSTRDSQLVDGMMASFGGESVMKDFKPSGTQYALAVKLTGKFKTAFPDGKPEEIKDESSGADKKPQQKKPDDSLKEAKQETAVILVGDSDMIYDGYTLRKSDSPFGTIVQQMNANLNFAQNAIEQLSGDNSLITVRSRAVLNRPFTRIKAMQAVAEAKYDAKLKELDESSDQTIKRLGELEQQKKSPTQRSIISPEQQAEIDNLKKKEADLGFERRRIKKELRREIVSLQRRIQWSNILVMPALVSLTGITLAVYKRKRTSAK